MVVTVYLLLADTHLSIYTVCLFVCLSVCVSADDVYTVTVVCPRRKQGGV